MKKILCVLICALLSIGAYSQKVTAFRTFVDSYNSYYMKVKICNTAYKTITCLVFNVTYSSPSMWDDNRYRAVKVRCSIRSRSYHIVSFYPPSTGYEPMAVDLERVIFSDGTYKDF